MHIQIVSVGKVKEKYIKLGIAEFEKRLRPYCKLTMDEVNAFDLTPYDRWAPRPTNG